MSDLTYEELVARNDRLARKIISMGDQFQEILRDEVKKAKARAWDEGSLARADRGLGLADNPYREEQ